MNLTTASTQTQSVQGNKRVVQVDVGAVAGTTSDTVSIHYLQGITAVYNARYTSTSSPQFNNFPVAFVGSAINSVQIVRSSLSTADALSFVCEGWGG